MSHKINKGLTLIELIIAIAILSLIVSLGYPSYAHHVQRAKITDATTMLSELQLRSAQQFQDDHTYINADNQCVVAAPSNEYFTFTCTATASAYLWTIQSKAGSGLGSANDYVFSIDHNGNKTTNRFSGTAVSKNCWILKLSANCS